MKHQSNDRFSYVIPRAINDVRNLSYLSYTYPMPFVNVYLKQSSNNVSRIREVIQKNVAHAASGVDRGTVREDEVEVFFAKTGEHDHLIKSLVIQVSIKKTTERVMNFQDRHKELFEGIKEALPEYSDDFSLQTTLSEHQYSEV